MRNLCGACSLLVAVGVGLFGTGCAPAFEVATKTIGSEASQGAMPDVPGEPNEPPVTLRPPTSTQPTNASTDVTLGICSRLDFVGVQWPAQLLSVERRAMALALNITGSFEGSEGWSNLSNNFDGQGMSLGLNQQNFGQGSLQPLLVSVMKTNPSLMKTLFSTSNLKSMTSMLSSWSVSASDTISKISLGENLFPDVEGLSALDENFGTVTAMDSRTAAAVTWAKQNLYLSNGSTFKTDWKNSFLSLAVSAPYRSVQVMAAMTMYAKAVGYYEAFKFKELRSLLVMYDFVVQNGGFTASHLASFASYTKANPGASETARLKKLLEIRLTSVRSQYRGDVSARKTAIINGSGVVHGAARNLQKEYCFAGTDTLKTN